MTERNDGNENAVSAVLRLDYNGPGTVECSDYHPTRHELTILARYWLDQRFDVATWCWFCACVGSSEMRI